MEADTLRGLTAGISIGIVLMTLLLAVMVHQLREHRGYRCLQQGALFLGAGLLGNALQEQIPIWLSLAAGYASLVLGQTLLWVGVERALGRKPRRSWLYLLPLATFVVGLVFGAIYPSLTLRLCINLVLLLIPTVFFIRVLWSVPHRGRALRWLLGIQILIALTLLARLVGKLGFDIPSGHVFDPHPFNFLLALLLLVLGMTSVICIILFVVERLIGQSQQLAETDQLTQCLNRLGLRRMIDRSRSDGKPGPIAVLALDLDHFKRINDDFGHDAGDAVLQGFARAVRSQLHDGDAFVRMGGEEFVVFAQRTEQDALVLAESIRKAVAQTHPGIPRVTVSIGVVPTASMESGVLREALKLSDEALYRAKREGRNRVCSVVFDPAAAR